MERHHSEEQLNLPSDELSAGEAEQDTVAMAAQERENYGPWEVEFSYGRESDLHKHFEKCKKNPGHTNSVPIDQFNRDCIPIVHDEDLVCKVRTMADLTVRVSVKYVSNRRPKTFPGRDQPYALCRHSRGEMMRTGTGLIISTSKYPKKNRYERNSTFLGSVTCDTCSCKECLSSGKPKRNFGHIYLQTAAHVVFDELEAANTTCHLFFDRGNEPNACVGVVTLNGMFYVEGSTKTDRCTLAYVTHDLDLVDRIEDIIAKASYFHINFVLCVGSTLNPPKYLEFNIINKMLTQNLTDIIIQRHKNSLTQEQFDFRIERLTNELTEKITLICPEFYKNEYPEHSDTPYRLKNNLKKTMETFLVQTLYNKLPNMTYLLISRQTITHTDTLKQRPTERLTKKAIKIQTNINKLINKLKDSLIKILTESLTHPLSDIETQTLKDTYIITMTDILTNKLIENVKELQIDCSIEELKDCWENTLDGTFKYMFQNNFLMSETLLDEFMHNQTEILTQTLSQLVIDRLPLLLAYLLEYSLTDIKHKQTDGLIQTLQESIKRILADNLKERLSYNKTNKLIHHVTQTVLDGLMQALKKRMAQIFLAEMVESIKKANLFVLDNFYDVTSSLQSSIHQMLCDRLKHSMAKNSNQKWLNKIPKTLHNKPCLQRNLLIQELIQKIHSISLDYLKKGFYRYLIERCQGRVHQTLSEITPVLTERLVFKFEYNLTQILNSVTKNLIDSPSATNSYKTTGKERLLMSERFLTDLTVIISHPHGCSKRVSVGFGTKTWDTSNTENQYIYTTATCPGTSGAAVLVCRMKKSSSHHDSIIHSAAYGENNRLNFGWENIVTLRQGLVGPPGS